jgi:alcohol dehydrogenase
MGGFSGDFQLPRLERVVSGANAVDRLSSLLAARGVSRIVLVTGRTLSTSPLLQRILNILEPWKVAVFAGARQHVPSCTVADLARTLDEQRADCVISFGGGSPIDTVKAALHEQRARHGAAPDEASPGEASLGEGPLHVAVPTTLSAGEFTAVAGVTDERTRVKKAIHDPGLAPRLVVTDPTLTLETPAWLWAATGVRALDHAVETLYSERHHPVGDALAARGLSILLEHLPLSLTAIGETQLEHRSWCQVGAWMSIFGLGNAGLGLSHALGHQIGARWDVPHGVTSCITLPHAMRLMADLAPERFGPIAAACGLSIDRTAPSAGAAACADRIDGFISQFALPRRLRDAGVPAGEVGEAARVAGEIMRHATVGEPRVTPQHLADLLARAY